jgi:hypothetical protein
MGGIATSIMAGLPLTGFILLCLCAMIAYVAIFAFSVVDERYDLVIIEIIIGVDIFIIVYSYAFGLNM